MRLIFVSRETLPEWLGKAAEHLAKIVEGSGGRLSESTLRAALEAGDYWLAVVDTKETIPGGNWDARGEIVPSRESPPCRAALVLHPHHYKTGLSELEVIGLAGVGLADWIHLEPELRAAAKAAGFYRLKPVCRPGWARVLKSQGYRMTHVILEATL